VVQASEPGEPAQEFVAKSGFQPGEVLGLRRPITGLAQSHAPLLAEQTPLQFALRKLNAAADEIAPLRGQSKMSTIFLRGLFAERTILLVEHAAGDLN